MPPIHGRANDANTFVRVFRGANVESAQPDRRNLFARFA